MQSDADDSDNEHAKVGDGENHDAAADAHVKYPPGLVSYDPSDPGQNIVYPPGQGPASQRLIVPGGAGRHYHPAAAAAAATAATEIDLSNPMQNVVDPLPVRLQPASDSSGTRQATNSAF